MYIYVSLSILFFLYPEFLSVLLLVDPAKSLINGIRADLVIDRVFFSGFTLQEQQVEGEDFHNPKPNSVETKNTLTLAPRSKRETPRIGLSQP